jgi:transcriptional regulator of arginine metabolism
MHENTPAPGGATGSTRREEAIRQLMRSGQVRSQVELRALLRRRGIAVAQPTLSRDLRRLGLAKTPRGYVLPEAVASPFTPATLRVARLWRALRTFVVSVQTAGSLVVVKTLPAGADPTARALDEAALPNVVGTIAGDDTVFVATPGEAAARALARRLTSGPERRDAAAGA